MVGCRGEIRSQPMRTILLVAVLAGVASLAFVQAQAQTRKPSLQECLANCKPCSPSADGTSDPTCVMHQQNCKADCERRGEISRPGGDILLAQGRNEPPCQQNCAKERRMCTGDYPKPDELRRCEAAEA